MKRFNVLVSFVCLVSLIVIGYRSFPFISKETLAIAKLRNQKQEASHAMVATSHQLASAAGVKMLKYGGNAVDAAAASAFVLSVVEPMMAGIGGGGSMTVWIKKQNEAQHIEFYASAGSDSGSAGPSIPDSLLSPEQKVAIPGTVAGLLSAQNKYGALSRQKVMAPAIRVARKGFIVHPLLARIIRDNKKKLHIDAAASKLFYPDGQPLRAGDRLVQTELAETLERISEEGKAGFYTGVVANTLVKKLQNGNSPMSLEDLKNFNPRWRNPLLGNFRGYTILAPPPPMAGMEVIETLKLLKTYDLSSMGYPVNNPKVFGLLVDALRLAQADRYAWNGDPRDIGVPATAISSSEYVKERRTLIGAAVSDTMPAGDPWDEVYPDSTVLIEKIQGFPFTSHQRPDTLIDKRIEDTDEPSDNQTTHLSIVDEKGNAVTLTFTMGQFFGSGVYSNGAFYNTAAANFNNAIANRWGPNRTPRSSTAPTMLLKNSKVRLVVGSPGSGRIPPAIIQMILYTLEYGISPVDAIYMPRIYPSANSRTVSIEDGFNAKTLKRLTEKGYQFRTYSPYNLYFGGVQMVYITEEGKKIGVSDPRRDGTVSGY